MADQLQKCSFMYDLEVKGKSGWKKKLGIISEDENKFYFCKGSFDKAPSKGWSSITLSSWIRTLKEPPEVVNNLPEFEFCSVSECEWDLRNEKIGETWQLRFKSSKRAAWIEQLSSFCMGGEKVYKETIETIKKRLKGKYIPPDDLTIDTTSHLGVGASGMVKLGWWQKQVRVAVKQLIGSQELLSKEEEEFLREIEMISNLSHPNIVRMFGYTNIENSSCLILEYVPSGSLSNFLQKDIHFNLFQIMDICTSIANGMNYIHRRNIIHRDLKPGNILVVNIDLGDAKICDFGLSLKEKKKEKIYGTPTFAAPELPNANHTNKVDVYSFAITAFELVFRKEPWPKMLGSTIAKAVENGERPQIPDSNHPLVNLIQQCWKQDPKERPGFEYIGTLLRDIREHSLSVVSPSTGRNLRTSIPEGIEGLTVDRAFDQAGGSILWEQFQDVTSRAMETSRAEVDGLKGLLSKEGMVRLKDWEKLKSWFSPLLSERTAKNGAVQGYAISEISSLIGQDWFFDLTIDETEKILRDSPSPKTHLVRFSSSPPFFALSAKLTVDTEVVVSHWKISILKKNYMEFIVTVVPGTTLFVSIPAFFLHHQNTMLPSSGFTLGSPVTRNSKAIVSPPTALSEEQIMDGRIKIASVEVDKAKSDLENVVKAEKYKLVDKVESEEKILQTIRSMDELMQAWNQKNEELKRIKIDMQRSLEAENVIKSAESVLEKKKAARSKLENERKMMKNGKGFSNLSLLPQHTVESSYEYLE